MKKSVLKLLLFFLLFGGLFTKIQCAENYACPSGNLYYSVARLTDEQIAKEYDQMVVEFRKSNKIHKMVQIGAYIATAAALGAICYYQFFAPGASEPAAESLRGYSSKQLTKMVGDLHERVRSLEAGPNFFSWAYIKSWCHSLLWSPITMLQASQFLIKLGDNYMNHVLYCDNLSWFLGEKTKLALLSKREAPSTVGYDFTLGQLPKNIEECVAALDGAQSALLPVDVDYQRRHLADCCNLILEDFSKLLAFAKYVDSLSTDEKNHFENAKCSRHSINCVNSFCEKIECCLNGTGNEKLASLVTAFNTDLQAIIIRFAQLFA